MDFGLTEEQVAVQRLARDFTARVIKPVAAHYDETEELAWPVVEEAFKVGLLYLNIPEEYGGAGLEHLTEILVAEEMAAGCLGITTTIIGVGLGVLPILIAGTPEQKETFLPPLCAQPALAAFCLTEPGAGSDVASMATTAVRDGDDYVIDGTKHFITNGGVARLYTAFAVTDRARGAKGISAFIVPGDAPGLSQGKVEKKLGIRASHTAEVVFDGVRVPAANRLGEEGQGFSVAMKTLDSSRPVVAAGGVGVARAALEAAVKYARERVQFGRPIAELQAIQFMLADMAMAVETARLVTRKAAWQLDRGEAVSMTGAMAKCLGGDAAMKVATEAVQVFGGYGYMREYPVEKYLRDAKIVQIYEGTNQIQRLVIARHLLG